MPRRHRINLLPEDLRPQLRLSLDVASVAAVSAVLCYMALSTSFYALQARSRQAELTRVETQARELAGQLEPLIKQKKLEDRQIQRLAFIEGLLDRKNRWSEAFKEFGRVLPRGVWFTGLSSVTHETGRRFVIKGEAVSQVKMAEFFSALEHSRFFGGASIDYSEKVPSIEPEVYRFELSVPIRGES